MADYIEGKRPVIEALRTGVPVVRVLLADNVKRDGLIEDVLRKAKAQGVEVQNVPRKKLDELSKLGERDSHQGVMAETKPFRYASGADAIRIADALDVTDLRELFAETKPQDNHNTVCQAVRQEETQ